METPKGTELPLANIKGKPYLQVAHRLVWFREERPTWGIETVAEEVTQTNARYRAYIKNEEGRIIASATKQEDKTGFADFVEKAETGSIGRALAMCGYGTQFAPELEEGERLVDSPIQPAIQKNTTQQPTATFSDRLYTCPTCHNNASIMSGVSPKSGKPYKGLKCSADKTHMFWSNSVEYKQVVGE